MVEIVGNSGNAGEDMIPIETITPIVPIETILPDVTIRTICDATFVCSRCEESGTGWETAHGGEKDRSVIDGACL